MKKSLFCLFALSATCFGAASKDFSKFRIVSSDTLLPCSEAVEALTALSSPELLISATCKSHISGFSITDDNDGFLGAFPILSGNASRRDRLYAEVYVKKTAPAIITREVQNPMQTYTCQYLAQRINSLNTRNMIFSVSCRYSNAWELGWEMQHAFATITAIRK